MTGNTYISSAHSSTFLAATESGGVYLSKTRVGVEEWVIRPILRSPENVLILHAASGMYLTCLRDGCVELGQMPCLWSMSEDGFGSFSLQLRSGQSLCV